TIAMSGLGFGPIDRFVHAERAPGRLRQLLEDQLERTLADEVVYDARHRDGAGIHHRIEWHVGTWIEHNRVEGVAARFDADARQHRLAAGELECETIDEGLRYRLDGEGLVRVPYRVQVAVDGGESDAERLRIDPGQLGNVVCECAGSVGPVARMG